MTGSIMPAGGDRFRLVWQNPPRSLTALSSMHGPAVGTSKSLTAVSSMPSAAAEDQVVGSPWSAAVRSSVP